MESNDDISFTKIFNYDKTGNDWDLPEPATLFSCAKQDVNSLIQLKSSLNKVKSSLNGYDIKEWNKHTNYVNPAGRILQTVRKRFEPELPTQAWCKFYEILSHYLVIPFQCDTKFNAVHLCEAPGGFICSLNHFLKSHEQFKNVKYTWIANALNPYHEGNALDQCILDDRLICKTLRSWYFGKDNTGNIMQQDFLDDLKDKCKCHTTFDSNPVDLVTADGSFNCQSQPAEQETIVAHLKYTEAFTALHILGTGGTFVIKMFTLFEYHSVSLIYLFCCIFDSVTVIKPATSKAGNSEAYVVSAGYCGSITAKPYLDKMAEYFPFKDVIEKHMSMISVFPDSFLEQHVNCTKYFSEHQKVAIGRNVHLFHHRSRFFSTDIKALQQIFIQRYFDLCEMRRISPNSYIVRNPVAKSHFRQTPKMEGTFSKRVMQRNNLERPVVEQNLWNKPMDFNRMCDEPILNGVVLTSGLVPKEINSSLYCSTDVIVSYSNAYQEAATHGALQETPPTLQTGSKMLSENLQECICHIIRRYEGLVTTLCLLPDTRDKVSLYTSWFESLLKSTCPNSVMTFQSVEQQFSSNCTLGKPNFIFCNFVSDSNQVWCEVNLRSKIICALISILQALPNGGSCLVILPSVLLRLIAHALYIFSCTFEHIHIQATCLHHADTDLPGVAVVAENFGLQGSETLDRVLKLFQESSMESSGIVEFFPATYLMISEDSSLATSPKSKFVSALKSANEVCLDKLTTMLEKRLKLQTAV
uniref:Cap-specific mRNA (nucleoside-2'-O-)-methyltransferase 2 n=1 Tax=Phallusia mammillata TaxID=59560 RepID=A0A6F9DA74_9ASCI|nr:cap-specific mRNA (nucleoside-2'-O-)-methyltransferase 2-like [Phallusia mammillata]